MMTDQAIQYPVEFTNRLEILWGEGFLSPGGPEEVKEILKDIDLLGKSILDIGCGTGAVEIVLARDLGADRIVGIDVEPQLVKRTEQRAKQAGISDRVDVQLVEPGPLGFSDNSFDVVFSKDSMIHISDKDAMFREVLRVLRPGGVFAASDWLVGEEADAMPEWNRFRELAHLSFKVATAKQTEAAMKKSGFERVSTVDRNEWYAPITVREVEQLEGILREQILEVVDEETYNHWLKIRRALRDSTNVGALRPTHMRGFKSESFS